MCCINNKEILADLKKKAGWFTAWKIINKSGRGWLYGKGWGVGLCVADRGDVKSVSKGIHACRDRQGFLNTYPMDPGDGVVEVRVRYKDLIAANSTEIAASRVFVTPEAWADAFGNFSIPETRIMRRRSIPRNSV